MNYLFVVAHPDDEVLGAGATIYTLLQEGHNVSICSLSSKCRPRYDMSTDELLDRMKDSHDILDIKNSVYGNYGCLFFKDEPHQEMVEFVERCMIDTKAEVIITNHPSDLNNDHYITSIVCQEAARLSQRQITNVTPLKRLLYMEVPSSTDWYLNTGWGAFKPNTYFGVSKEAMQKKIDSLLVYNNVIRKPPHPRSVQSLEALAVYRGSQCGHEYAEAFELVFQIGV